VLLLGVDEAGYGPNLGPLVISATLWRMPESVRAEDLDRLLARWIARTAPVAGDQSPRRVAIADSKILYHPGKGLAGLERGLLAALAAIGRRPSRWSQAWTDLAPAASAALASLPWYAGYDEPLPIGASAEEIADAASILEEAFRETGIRITDIRSRAVFEEEFNRRVDEDGSKGAVLTRATLRLVADLLASADGLPARIVCDKHGGRNSYAALLEEVFPHSFLEIRGESRQRSVYRFGPPERRVEIRFEAKGESHLPTALASMASKYLRELAMRALNAFWRTRVPGLAPTAGYPADAKRFKEAITEAQRQLALDDRRLWRSR
jgi:ribonuclease HII